MGGALQLDHLLADPAEVRTDLDEHLAAAPSRSRMRTRRTWLVTARTVTCPEVQAVPAFAASSARRKSSPKYGVLLAGLVHLAERAQGERRPAQPP
jgi:hypothetical protein